MIDHCVLQNAWNLAPIVSTRIPDTGTIHQTLLIKTSENEYVLRAYRYREEERWRITREHALITYVQAQGLPAIAPVALSTGGTILEYEQRYYALFPFATGHQVRREELSIAEASAMGTFLAQLHNALQGYPAERVQQRSFTADLTVTLAKIDEIEATIRSLPQLSELDLRSLTRLAQRRDWLATTRPVDLAAFIHLKQQVIHGDYQETNLFFSEGKVSAVIDWDQAHPAPRGWEIVRICHYAFKLNAILCSTFLDAYRHILPLTQEELEITAHTYGWIRAHDLWLYEELYLNNNQRVQQFVYPGNFTPFLEKWKLLQFPPT